LAARGLALLAAGRGDHASAADLYASAVGQARTCLPVLVEATDQLLAAGQPAVCLAIIDLAPEEIALHGQAVHSVYALCCPTGKPTRSVAYLKPGLRFRSLGGGDAGGALARGVRRPALAYHYDFRMRPDLNR
jgi:hypothetical protein